MDYETRPINRTDYAKVPAFFNPIKFDPAAWVALAKAAGMKYITITSKHHDGFAMFDSRLTDWNIVARTLLRQRRYRDARGGMSQARHQAVLVSLTVGLALDRLFFARAHGTSDGAPDSGNWDAYLNFMDGQLRELLTDLRRNWRHLVRRDVGQADADWHLARTYALIHQLQPRRWSAAIIIESFSWRRLPNV